MKGVKTMSIGNGTAKQFQTDHLLCEKVTLNGNDLNSTLR